MAKSEKEVEVKDSKIAALEETVAKQGEQIEKLIAALTEAKAAPKVEEKSEDVKKSDLKPVTLQHVRPIRTWTVKKADVIKVHRGTLTVNHPRFKSNVILNPGCVVTVTGELGRTLIKSRDFQKYGV